jgi:hypothetical protein
VKRKNDSAQEQYGRDGIKAPAQKPFEQIAEKVYKDAACPEITEQ